MYIIKKVNRCIIALLLFLVSSNVYSEENTGFKIGFANTTFGEHYSDVLLDDVRTEHDTITNEPAFYINEKLQLVISFTGNQFSQDENCCVDIPSSVYGSINAVYTYHENYATRAGMEFELGFGNYLNPLISAGVGFTKQKDMVFESKEDSNVNWFFSAGYMDDTHISCDFEIDWSEDTRKDESDRRYIRFDSVIGYKKISNFFLKYNADLICSQSNLINNSNIDYVYQRNISYTHIQYYGNSYGFSAGYSYSYEKYWMDYYDEEGESLIKHHIYKKSKSNGGGFTFYYNDIASCLNLFGEFHLLADKDKNLSTVSKFGAKVYF